MRITFEGDHLICELPDFRHEIEASCVVRHELNGRRRLHDPKEVVRAMCENPYDKPPVMPREFPKGAWEVYLPMARRDPYLEPYFIPTSAERYVEVWELDAMCGYDHGTGVLVRDLGYGLHYSGNSITTVGCIRISERNDLLWLVNVIQEEIHNSRRVVLIV